jgi:hypothetical protein
MMSPEMPFKKEIKFPQGVIPLADAQTAEKVVLEKLRTSKDKEVSFGITFDVLKESLKQKDLPLNATIRTLKGRFRSDPKDSSENIFILEGEARLGKKDVPFGLALGNDDGKISVKGLRLNAFAKILVNPFLSDIDGMIKREINERIGSIGEVTGCSIGNRALECTISKKEGDVMKVSILLTSAQE